MKTLVTVISVVFLFVTSSSMDVDDNLSLVSINSTDEIMTYDAFEGGYHFFTNEKNLPVVLEIKDEKILQKTDLINGDYIAKKMKVKYVKYLKLKEESSSQGLIKDIVLLQ